MYPGTAAADSTTQAQNQSIPDFVRGYNNTKYFLEYLTMYLFYEDEICTNK
jgi:hypothetical protein